MTDYYEPVYRLAFSLLGDPAEADDAAQETFLQATLRLHQYRPGTSIKAWIMRIAVNASLGRLRRAKTRRQLQAVLNLLTMQARQSEPTPEETVIQREIRHQLRCAVDQLDEKHRIPVLLRYTLGMSVPEIAQALEINEGTVHSRLHYANQKLRQKLAAVEGDTRQERQA